jgi:hypothetical protein
LWPSQNKPGFVARATQAAVSRFPSLAISPPSFSLHTLIHIMAAGIGVSKRMCAEREQDKT